MALSAAEKKRMAREYTDLHEGLPPRSIQKVPLRKPPKKLIALGKLTDVVYAKETTEGSGKQAPLYHHPFKPHAQPLLARDEHGKLHVLEGNYVVNERGIVDQMRKNPMRRKVKKSARAPLAGHAYLANPTRSVRRKGMRKNPMEGGNPYNPAEQARRVLKEERTRSQALQSADFLDRALRAIAAGIAFEVVTDVALNYLPWGPSTRGVVQGSTGLLGAILLHRVAPNAALGLAVAGMTNMVHGGIADYRTQNFLASMGTPGAATPPANNAQPSTPATTPNPPANTTAPGGRLNSSNNNLRWANPMRTNAASCVG